MYRELIPKEGQILVLRKVASDMTSYKGSFTWPQSGPVEAPDWQPHDICGNGLHGLPWGEGGDYLIGVLWVCCLVNTSTDNYIHGSGDMVDKCKFRRAEDVSVGTQEEVILNVQKYAPINTRINYAIQVDTKTDVTQTAGYRSTQTADNGSTQTAGNDSTQTAGNNSTQTAGINSVQIIHYYEDGWQVKCRLVTEVEANKAYIFHDGDWHLTGN